MILSVHVQCIMRMINRVMNGFHMPKYLCSLTLVCLFLGGCNSDAKIYHAKYLDDIFPNSDTEQNFIVKSNFWNRPTCGEIE